MLGFRHFFRTDNKFKEQERLCNNHNYCEILMPAEGKNILRYNPIENSLNKSRIFYLDIESLLVKIQPQQNNNLEEFYTERKAIDEACSYSLKLISSYDSKKDKHSYSRGTDCIKKLCKDMKDQAIEIINI